MRCLVPCRLDCYDTICKLGTYVQSLQNDIILEFFETTCKTNMKLRITSVAFIIYLGACLGLCLRNRTFESKKYFFAEASFKLLSKVHFGNF